MNSRSFVLDCQEIRRITAGYECVIIMSLQAWAELSPCVFRKQPNCCPITLRHLLDYHFVCLAELICEMLKISLSCLSAVILCLCKSCEKQGITSGQALWDAAFLLLIAVREMILVFLRNSLTHPALLLPSYVRPATLNFSLSRLCGPPFMVATESRSLTTGLNLISVLIWSNLLAYDRSRTGRSGCARRETL